jgi:hypothetical protein
MQTTENSLEKSCPSFLNWDMKIGRALDHCFREEVDANATK